MPTAWTRFAAAASLFAIVAPAVHAAETASSGTAARPRPVTAAAADRVEHGTLNPGALALNRFPPRSPGRLEDTVRLPDRRTRQSLLLESAMFHAPFRMADLASTEYALRHPSLREVNPLGQSFGARVGITLAASAGATWLDYKLKHKKIARWVLRVGHAVGTGFILQNNLRHERSAAALRR